MGGESLPGDRGRRGCNGIRVGFDIRRNQSIGLDEKEVKQEFVLQICVPWYRGTIVTSLSGVPPVNAQQGVSLRQKHFVVWARSNR